MKKAKIDGSFFPFLLLSMVVVCNGGGPPLGRGGRKMRKRGRALAEMGCKQSKENMEFAKFFTEENLLMLGISFLSYLSILLRLST